MTLVKRITKGSPLTYAEGDDNLDHVMDLANATGSLAPEKVTQDETHRFWTDVDKAALAAVSGNFARIGALIDKPIVVSRFGGLQKAFSDGISVGKTYSWSIPVKFLTTGVRFIFPNWSLGNSIGGAAGEAIGLNDIIVSAGIYGYAGGGFSGYKRIYFNNQTTIRIPPGGTVRSDALPWQFITGITNYVLRVYVSVDTAGQKWPLGYSMQSTLGEGTFEGDATMGTAVTTVTAPGYHPIAVIGTPQAKRTSPNVLMVGDSIFDGNANGGTGIEADQGWARRGLDAINVTWMKMAVGGDKMLNHLQNTNGFAFLFANSGGMDIALCNYGANDMPTFATFADAQAMYVRFWNALAGAGMRVRQATVLPRTGASAFSTATEAIRVQINDWIRTKPAPLDGYIEAADLAETSRNSGVWKAGYTADGVHPNYNVGEPAIAACILSSDFLI